MIQRVQSIYLLLAIIACVVCLCLPVGELRGTELSVPALLFNGCVVAAQGAEISVSPITIMPLFVTLVLSATIALFTLFLYKKRPLQMRMCIYAIILIVIWYVALAFIAMLRLPEGTFYHPSFTIVLPFLAACLFWLARHNIRKDERLVRSADRIRD